jgi:hypothetical protein
MQSKMPQIFENRNYTQISSFQEVKIKTNTLVLCDIDETVLRFDGIDKKWWHRFE